MRNKIILFILLSLWLFNASALAQLDLEQDVIVIPDTHEVEKYRRKVIVKPDDIDFTLTPENMVASVDTEFRLFLQSKKDEKIGKVHIFVTNETLNQFNHIYPEKKGDDTYRFLYYAPMAGKYRLEIIFESERGWINLKKDIVISEAKDNPDIAKREKDVDLYHVKVESHPQKVYSEHVVTFVYDLSYNGAPIEEIERIGDATMHLAAWNEDLDHFVYYITDKNMINAKAAISAVFMHIGTYKVFTEFKHNSETNIVDFVVDIKKEPEKEKQNMRGTIWLEPEESF